MAERDDDRPIEVLSDLEVPTDAEFVENVRKKIDRQETTNHLLSLSWEVPRLVVMEFVVMVLEIVLPHQKREGDER